MIRFRSICAGPGRRERPGLSASVAALALVTGVCACAPQHGGPAVDYAVRSSVTTLINGEVNRSLEANENDSVASAGVNMGLIIDAQTKRTDFGARLGLNSTYFVGEDDDVAGTGRVDPNLNFDIAHRSNDLIFGVNASAAARDTNESQIDDTGITDRDATQIDASFATSLQYALDSTNTASWSAGYRITEFVGDDTSAFTPVRTIFTDASWRTQINRTNTLTLNAGLRDFTSDNLENTNSQSLDLSASLIHARTPRHTLNGSAGLSAVRTVEDFTDSPDFNIGFNGGFGMQYTGKTFSAGFDASQSVQPSSDGEIQSVTRIVASAEQQINTRQSIRANAIYAFRSDISGDDDTLQSLNIGPTYTYALNRQTRLSLSYLYRVQIEDGDVPQGHRIGLALTRDFDLLP